MSEKNKDEKQKELDCQEQENAQIRETGEAVLDQNRLDHRIELLTVIGEVEGHETAPSQSKTTKYEHVLPKLAMIEDDKEVEGLLILLNTVGGDVEARACHCGNDRILKHTHGLSGARRRTFHWNSHGCISGLFLCCCKRNDGDPSGTVKRDVYRSGTDLPKYGKDPGPYHRIYRCSFQGIQGTPGRTNAGYQSACEGCRDFAGR